MKLELEILETSVSVHRFSHDSIIPQTVYRSPFLTISRTAEELSIVCDSSIMLESEGAETNWHIIKVRGPLDFSLTGVFTAITGPLAAAQIPVFAVSTFDTDYFLVKSDHIAVARNILEETGFKFLQP